MPLLSRFEIHQHMCSVPYPTQGGRWEKCWICLHKFQDTNGLDLATRRKSCLNANLPTIPCLRLFGGEVALALAGIQACPMVVFCLDLFFCFFASGSEAKVATLRLKFHLISNKSQCKNKTFQILHIFPSFLA